MVKKGQITLFVIIGLIVVASVGTSLFIYQQAASGQSEDAVRSVLKTELAPVSDDSCVDGTPFNSCSTAKPFYCEDNLLYGNCELCGCPVNAECLANGLCEVKEVKEDFVIYLVPINYELNDPDFIQRAEILKASVKLTTPLKDSNFVYIDEVLRHPSSQCTVVTQQFYELVNNYLQLRTGEGLAPLKYEGAIPVFNYRIIGLDKNVQDILECGCAHTLIYSPNVYIGGAPCSREVHTALHELGHTFGLCDEYDTCTWDDTSATLQGAFGHPCLNVKPDRDNSDCGVECCSSDGACCNGKFDNEGFYNVMGSSDVPPERKVNIETGIVITNFLCDNIGVCNE